MKEQIGEMGKEVHLMKDGTMTKKEGEKKFNDMEIRYRNLEVC